MVGTHDLIMDVSGDDVVFQIRGYHEVVQPPTNIALTRPRDHVPPGVLDRIGVQVPVSEPAATPKPKRSKQALPMPSLKRDKEEASR